MEVSHIRTFGKRHLVNRNYTVKTSATKYQIKKISQILGTAKHNDGVFYKKGKK